VAMNQQRSVALAVFGLIRIKRRAAEPRASAVRRRTRSVVATPAPAAATVCADMVAKSAVKSRPKAQRWLFKRDRARVGMRVGRRLKR
jgi:hypothetical protein